MPIGRIGQEFIVNTTATESQFEPSITALPDGRFVATWHSLDGGDGSGTCIRARVFNADGSAAGNDFTVNNTTTGNQEVPSVTALADGRFVVAWTSADTGDGSGSCIRARIFDADGSATNAGNDFVVNTTAADHQVAPSVTALADGRFIAAWQSYDAGDGSGFCIRARLYNADGGAAGKDFVVNSTAADNQYDPSITALADGRFVATWASNDTGDGAGTCIRARLYNADGSAASNDFIVETTTAGNQAHSAVTALADGRFVVTWASVDTGDGNGACIRARVFNGNGSAAGNDFVVDSTTTGDQGFPSVAALADGRFVVAWESADAGDGDGTCIRVRVYNIDGGAAGSDFIVNTTAEANQVSPSVAALADGRFVVTWSSADEGDGSFTCIRARMFDPTVFVGTASADVWRGGNLADTINGDDSADTLSGLGGDDTIGGDAGQDTLSGGNGNDRLFGGADRDVLNGNAGADVMAGGMDDDIYFVDSAADRIIEAAGLGADRVFASASYVLDAGSAVELLLADNTAGTSAINLTGNALANALAGNAGANILNGGGGADQMEGYGGNDTYIVDNAGDLVGESGGAAEASVPSGGSASPSGDVDRVVSFISFSLSNANRVFGEVENLTLAGTGAINGAGNSLANVIVGNAAANVLSGLYGNDTLIGGLGTDRLIGELGNDVYVLENGNDTVSESGGIDTITSTITRSLARYAPIERLTLTGTAAINGTGNALANVLVGNTAANALSGLAGNDTLIANAGNDTLTGGLGKDTMTGGAGADRFDFNLRTESVKGANRDVIADFSRAQRDRIDLSTIDADIDGTAGNQAFRFIGAGAFSGVDGQLRCSAGIVQGDVNGDRIADFEVKVNVATLVAGDFLL